MTAESLFAECIIPGCKQPVADELTPCDTCRTIFGPMLQEHDRPPSYTAADLAERDADTAAAYRMMLGIRHRTRGHRPRIRPKPPCSQTRTNRSTEARRGRKAQPDLLALRGTPDLHPPPPRMGMPHVPRNPLTTTALRRQTAMSTTIEYSDGTAPRLALFARDPAASASRCPLPKRTAPH
ncbi:hypothetical protein M1M07_22795 [Rhodococcus sp. HM1]|uniref:hypothetical protein n=1 Tax=Rhodococcus sp. HM1 TaxID=2937759 RepID=UPI00200B9E2C|nr:hypothetical protein [Rhodococcus sp. HM1]MCK8673924.1 hypothetical protein [Rhodococcus sp. HM1]